MTIEINSGETISSAAHKACELAKEKQCEVWFYFNELSIYVYPKSFYTDIVRIYQYQCEIRRLQHEICRSALK